MDRKPSYAREKEEESEKAGRNQPAEVEKKNKGRRKKRPARKKYLIGRTSRPRTALPRIAVLLLLEGVENAADHIR